MKRKSIRLWSGLAVVAVAAATATAITTYAQAGDFNDAVTYDFDCDDKRDAVKAYENATVDGHSRAGSVTVKYSKTGKKATITQATAGVPGSPESNDYFGSAVAAYDENGDGCDDLIIAANQEDVADKNGVEQAEAGMITVIPGSKSGLNTKASRGVHMDTPGVPGTVVARSFFGSVLAAEDSSAEPYLLVSAPNVNQRAGAAYFFRGSKSYRITQNSPGVSGTSEPGDEFGSHFAVSDRYFAVSARDEAVGEAGSAGMTHVFGLQVVDGTLEQLGAVTQDTPGISDSAEAYDGFGGGVSVVPYQPTPDSEVIPLLSVGAGGESADTDAQVGMAHLIAIPSKGEYQEITTADMDTVGDPGLPGERENFGYSTVLAPMDESGIATPSTTKWVVVGSRLDSEGDSAFPRVNVLNANQTPGQDAKLVEGDDYGLPLDESGIGCRAQADPTYLYCGDPSNDPAVYGVPWVNILNGEDEPIVVYKV